MIVDFKKVLKVQGYLFIVMISTFSILYTAFSFFGRSYAVPVGLDETGIPKTDFNSNFAVGATNYSNYISKALASDTTYASYLHNFNTATDYKISNSDTPLYEFMKNMKVPETDEVFELHDTNPSDISDLGILYIINHGYSSTNTTNTVFTANKYGAVSDNNVKQYITQLALWLYIYENSAKFTNTYCMETNTKNLNACSFYIQDTTNVITPTDVRNIISAAASKSGYNYLNYILELVNNANSATTAETSTMAPLSSDKLSFTINSTGNLFTTEAITPLPNTNKSNYLYYTVEIEDPNNYGVYIVDQNNSRVSNTSVMTGSFKIVVPLKDDVSTMDLTTVKVNVYGTFLAGKGYEYYVTKTAGEAIVNTNKKQVFSNVSLGYTPINRVLVSLSLGNFVKISKIDATTKSELAGASLVITNKADTTKKWEWVSTTTPHYISLEDGTYSLCETQAPNGYVLNTTCIDFTVDNSKIVPVVMENDIKVPDTGKFSSAVPYIFGGIVGLFGIMIISVTIKRKKINE